MRRGGSADDKEDGQLTWLETVGNVINHLILPVRSNELSPHFAAVRMQMTRLNGVRIPGLLTCPTLSYIRRAYASGYRFRKWNIPGSSIYSPKLERNEWSHGAEADQYILLGAGEWHEVAGREERRRESGYAGETSYGGDFFVLGQIDQRRPNTICWDAIWEMALRFLSH